MTTPMLRRYGFRTVIVVADIVAGVTMILCGLVGARTPLIAIIALLAISGAARSAGFTAYNTVTFADVDGSDLRHANTIAWTAFQLSIGVGVALGAVALRLGTWTAPTLGGGSATPAYRVAFVILAALTLLAGAQALRLRHDAGAPLLTGRRDPVTGGS